MTTPYAYFSGPARVTLRDSTCFAIFSRAGRVPGSHSTSANIPEPIRNPEITFAAYRLS